jgi:acetyltransferase-like isoleucine patch superfamily enzyme
MRKNNLSKTAVPYYDEEGLSFLRRMSIYGKARSMGPLRYLMFKIRISLLQTLAAVCPFNSMRIRLHRMRGVKIGKEVYIGKKVFIDNLYPDFIVINDKAHLHTESMIIAHFNPARHFRTIFEAAANPVEIGEGSIIGIRAIVMPGITVGPYAVVTAGSVVTKNVQSMTLVQGNPARKALDFKNIFTEKTEEDKPE